jgi:predicted glycosyltransferase
MMTANTMSDYVSLEKRPLVEALARGGRPRVMLFYPGFSGLGHDRNAIVWAEALRARWPSRSLLIVGSSRGCTSVAWPDDIELVKLPSIVRVADAATGQPFGSPTLDISFQRLSAMRQQILLNLMRYYAPDLFLADQFPTGPLGELLPALRELKAQSPDTPIVLGLRDIMYHPDELRREWARDQVYDALRSLYDRILVFGQQDLYDLIGAAGLESTIADKVRYLGYIHRRVTHRSADEVRKALHLQTDRLVLVTVGGGLLGGDLVLECVIEALRLVQGPPRFDCVIVAGPMLPQEVRDQLRARVPAGLPIQFLDAVPDLTPYIAAADLVVSRAGYNTVCEILSFRRPALLLPIVVIGPQRSRFGGEQVLRAEAIQRLGLARMLHPNDMTPRRLLSDVLDLLDKPFAVSERLRFDGLPNFFSELGSLLAHARGPELGLVHSDSGINPQLPDQM